MTALVELVVVTYENDLMQCVELIKSIRDYGFVQKDIKINLVINDTDLIYQQAIDLFCDVSNIKIYQRSDFGGLTWLNDAGWLTQQYLKLAIARLIDTPWYITVDSDQGLWQESITFDDWFLLEENSVKARYKSISFNEQGNQCFRDFWRRVADFWNIADIENHTQLLSEKPPVVMHTAEVNSMMDHSNVISPILNAQFHEYGAYWGYLIKQNRIENLYVPLQKMTKSHLLREGRPLPLL